MWNFGNQMVLKWSSLWNSQLRRRYCWHTKLYFDLWNCISFARRLLLADKAPVFSHFNSRNFHFNIISKIWDCKWVQLQQWIFIKSMRRFENAINGSESLLHLLFIRRTDSALFSWSFSALNGNIVMISYSAACFEHIMGCKIPT